MSLVLSCVIKCYSSDCISNLLKLQKSFIDLRKLKRKFSGKQFIDPNLECKCQNVRVYFTLVQRQRQKSRLCVCVLLSPSPCLSFTLPPSCLTFLPLSFCPNILLSSQWEKCLLWKPIDPSSMSETHVKVEGELALT